MAKYLRLLIYFLLVLGCTNAERGDAKYTTELTEYLKTLDIEINASKSFVLIFPAESCAFCIGKFNDFMISCSENCKDLLVVVPSLSPKKARILFSQKVLNMTKVDTTKYFYRNEIRNDSPLLYFCDKGVVLEKRILYSNIFESELRALSHNINSVE
jgi:hypothetical protein